jgi:hypothetical protein
MSPVHTSGGESVALRTGAGKHGVRRGTRFRDGSLQAPRSRPWSRDGPSQPSPTRWPGGATSPGEASRFASVRAAPERPCSRDASPVAGESVPGLTWPGRSEGRGPSRFQMDRSSRTQAFPFHRSEEARLEPLAEYGTTARTRPASVGLAPGRRRGSARATSLPQLAPHPGALRRGSACCVCQADTGNSSYPLCIPACGASLRPSPACNYRHPLDRLADVGYPITCVMALGG